MTSSAEVRRVLRRVFGHRAFRAGQEAVVEAVLAGHSALAVFATGSGKSLCYQLPACLLPGLTLVVSPLLALMKDQVEALQARGVAAARLDSTLSAAEAEGVLVQMEQGALRVLLVAPERLAVAGFRERLRGAAAGVSMLVVDEAHCISEWGHNFRPDYLQLGQLAKELGGPRVLALTATAVTAVESQIAQMFGIQPEHCFRTSVVRENLVLKMAPAAQAKRLEVLAKKLARQGRLPAIVYVTRQQTAEAVATELQRRGCKARAYHAGLTAGDRSEAQEAFMKGTVEVMVATVAFGMGIDKGNVRAVYHFNLPKSLEHYQQETGRAGRDGRKAWCELLASAEDAVEMENLIHGDTPTPLALRQVVEGVLRLGRSFAVNFWELSRVYDLKIAVLETVLTYLEIGGLVEPVGRSAGEYRVKFTRDAAAVLRGRDAGQQAFLQTLLDCGAPIRRGVRLRLDAAEAATGEDRERIVTVLQELEAAGEVVLEPMRRQVEYRRKDDGGGEAAEACLGKLQAIFQDREARDRARFLEVLEFAMTPGCLVQKLGAYFSETVAQPCGQCSGCVKWRAVPEKLAVPSGRELTRKEVSAIREVMDERKPALRSPRALTRFLLGLSSPAAWRDRLTRHEAFGLLAGVPFLEVLEQVESMIA